MLRRSSHHYITGAFLWITACPALRVSEHPHQRHLQEVILGLWVMWIMHAEKHGYSYRSILSTCITLCTGNFPVFFQFVPPGCSSKLSLLTTQSDYCASFPVQLFMLFIEHCTFNDHTLNSLYIRTCIYFALISTYR